MISISSIIPSKWREKIPKKTFSTYQSFLNNPNPMSAKKTVLSFDGIHKIDLLELLFFILKNIREKQLIHLPLALVLREQNRLNEAVFYFERIPNTNLSKANLICKLEAMVENSDFFAFKNNIKDFEDLFPEDKIIHSIILAWALKFNFTDLIDYEFYDVINSDLKDQVTLNSLFEAVVRRSDPTMCLDFIQYLIRNYSEEQIESASIRHVHKLKHILLKALTDLMNERILLGN